MSPTPTDGEVGAAAIEMARPRNCARAALIAAYAHPGGTVARLTRERDEAREKLEQREAFLRYIDDENAEQPFDQEDEERRLIEALAAVKSGDLLTAVALIYSTPSVIAQEFLRRKHLAQKDTP